MNIITKLQIVPLRTAFPNEASDLTGWLAGNLDALGERLDMQLTLIGKEKSVGKFKVDLFCQDGEGRKVIIENQLEETDHDHLGKLMTYLVNLDAKTAIWVTSDPRAEHQKVIEWLNENMPDDMAFYLVKVEAIRNRDTGYSPLFTVLTAPDEQARKVGAEKKEWAEKDIQRLEFWKGLLERSKAKTKLFSNIKPGRYQYIQTGAGKAGIVFRYAVYRDWGTIDLYIDNDQETGEGNKVLFDALFAQKDIIEKEFGGLLQWYRLDDGTRCSIIQKTFESGGLAKPEIWPLLQDQMIDAMIRFDAALRPRLPKISI